MPEEYEVPQQLGEYQRRHLIARGGMGEVWLATKRGLEKPCVVKVLLPRFSRDPEYRRRFFREAKILAKLRHSRIVSIIDSGESEGWLYIVMDYIDGVDLGRFHRALAAQGEPIPVEVVGYIVGEVFEALRHAHNRAPGGRPLGIIHRDITPGNVLVSSEGEVFVTDFGLARHTTELSGEVFGTLEYMAPEQADGVTTFQSDLYGVGGLIHFMLTGRPPRKARNATELMVNRRPMIGDLGRSDVPEPILKLMRMCLAPDLTDRLATANDGIVLLDSSLPYGKRTTVTSMLYKRYVGPGRTGLTDLLPAAKVVEPYVDEPPPLVVGGTVRVAPGGTVRVVPTQRPGSGGSSPQPESTVVLPPMAPNVQAPSEPVLVDSPVASIAASELSPVASSEPRPPELLWRPWWGDEGERDDADIEEGVTTRFVPPPQPRPRSLPPPHLAEPDAPRLFRRPRGLTPPHGDALASPAQKLATERMPPPFELQRSDGVVGAASPPSAAITSAPTLGDARSGETP